MTEKTNFVNSMCKSCVKYYATKACSNCLHHGNCYQEECYTTIQSTCEDWQEHTERCRGTTNPVWTGCIYKKSIRMTEKDK